MFCSLHWLLGVTPQQKDLSYQVLGGYCFLMQPDIGQGSDSTQKVWLPHLMLCPPLSRLLHEFEGHSIWNSTMRSQDSKMGKLPGLSAQLSSSVLAGDWRRQRGNTSVSLEGLRQKGHVFTLQFISFEAEIRLAAVWGHSPQQLASRDSL